MTPGRLWDDPGFEAAHRARAQAESARWDDPGFEAAHRARAEAEAARWDDDALASRYGAFFAEIARGGKIIP